MKKRFNPDEIRATEISSRLNRLRISSGEHLTGQVGQAGQAEDGECGKTKEEGRGKMDDGGCGTIGR